MRGASTPFLTLFSGCCHYSNDWYDSKIFPRKHGLPPCGENIYPREIEEYLFGMEGIIDVQVVGVPSKKYGEEVGAFIIKKEGTDLTPEDVRDYSDIKPPPPVEDPQRFDRSG